MANLDTETKGRESPSVAATAQTKEIRVKTVRGDGPARVASKEKSPL